jgi:glycerol kinase
MLMHTGDRPVPSGHNLLTTVAWRLNGQTEYALEGSVFIAGAAVQWLRDGLGIIRESSEIEGLAASVPDSGGVFVVPAFSGLGAPHWDPYARGTIIGISRGTTAGHIARATLESIAFQTDDLLAAMEADSGVRLAELRVDGGASVNNLLMQFQSDLIGVNVIRPRVSETTALGAAFLAGLAVGFWTDREEIAGFWQKDRTFTPQMPVDRVQQLKQSWSRAVERSKGWEMQ